MQCAICGKDFKSLPNETKVWLVEAYIKLGQGTLIKDYNIKERAMICETCADCATKNSTGLNIVFKPSVEAQATSKVDNNMEPLQR